VGRRWCDHLDPVCELVECSGERHRMSWRRGALVVEDHDLEAERAMKALGAETPACLRLLKQWRDVHSWATSPELFVQVRDRLGPERILAPGALARACELSLLLTWERAWRTSSYRETGHERLLADQLRERALAPLAEHLAGWAQRLEASRTPTVEVGLARPGKAPQVAGRMDRFGTRASVTLGVRWALTVGARGLAVVDDGFVLELLPSPRRLVARAVRWERQGDGGARAVVAPARLDRDPSGSWRLAWEAP
jgi:hypothetical protein